MTPTARTSAYTYKLTRAIAKYKPEVRASLRAAIAKKENDFGRELSAEELAGCAFDVIFNDADVRMEKICREAMRAGKSRPITELIDELRTRSPRSTNVPSTGVGPACGS